MPARTRAEMHVGLDFALETLTSTPMNRIDPPIKDYFLNRTISDFVNKAVENANKNVTPVLFNVSLEESISKYNDIRTLISSDETIVAGTSNTRYNTYTLPATLFRFEASYTSLKQGAMSSYIQLPNVLLNTNNIAHYNIKPVGHYLCAPTIMFFPLLGTILDTTALRVYLNSIYTIEKVGIIFIKKPAILTDSPGVVNCDLPDSVHDKIVDETAKFIAAAVNSGSYEKMLIEAKQNINDQR